MATLRPVTFTKVDERQTRLHALLIMLAALCFVLTEQPAWIALVIYDFSVRVYISPKASPLFWIAALLLKTFQVPARILERETGVLSDGIGLAVSVAACWLALAGYRQPSLLLMEILALCTGVEALLRLRVGDELHAFLRRHRIEIVPLKDEP